MTPVVAPVAPTGLAASSGNAQASLTWTASSGATSYSIRRSTTSGASYTQVATSTSPAYTDATVSNGTTYYYVVAAINSAGTSSNSTQATASPVAPAGVQKTLVLTPTVTTVAYGGSIQFMASITGSAGALIVWSIQEAGSGGSIATDGRYTAPNVAGTFHVVATSSADSTLKSTATVTVSAPQGTAPTLVPGVWKDITPPAPGMGSTFGAAFLELSPVDPNVIYVSIDTLGLWKTTDRGSNWRRVGIQAAYQWNGRTTYLDSPVRVEVDPGNPNHLYATQGIRGNTLGFWVSTDGGESWTQPQGFIDASKNATIDVTAMEVDPTNFNHILLGSHQPWPNGRPPGIMESLDGGNSWILREGVAGWPTGTQGIAFLYNPATGQGNSSTWLVSTESAGTWRTTNSGVNWVKVSNFNTTHGGGQPYYAKDGTLYLGGAQYPVRSRDNGVTWEQVQNGLTNWYYYSVYGDGDTLYTQLSLTGDNLGQGQQPYMSAPESTGGPWTPYKGGAQKFINGPGMMAYDAANQIMYSANWRGGLWALKVIKP